MLQHLRVFQIDARLLEAILLILKRFSGALGVKLQPGSFGGVRATARHRESVSKALTGYQQRGRNDRQHDAGHLAFFEKIADLLKQDQTPDAKKHRVVMLVSINSNELRTKRAGS